MGTRTRVLSAFKEIHRTCQYVFAGDREALIAARTKINYEFKRFKDEPSPKKVEDHIQWAADSSRLLKLTVVQGKLTDDGRAYEMRVTRDTYLEDNVMFDPYADIPVKPQRKKKAKTIDSATFDIGKISGKMTVKKKR